MEGCKVILYALAKPLRYVCWILRHHNEAILSCIVWLMYLCMPSLVPFVTPNLPYALLSHPATNRPSRELLGWRFALNGPDRFSEREGNHREHRRVVMGVCPALGCRGRRPLASTVGDFAMPLQPIGSIVLRCVEGVRMPLEGEQGHCSRRSSGDTETLLWGHWGDVVGTVGLSVSLSLFCARASLSHRSWTISIPPYLSSAVTPTWLLPDPASVRHGFAYVQKWCSVLIDNAPLPT